MKRPLKIVAYFLAFLFLAVNSNVNLSLHYCHDSLVEVSVDGTKESCCSSEKKCCGGCEDVEVEMDFDADILPLNTNDLNWVALIPSQSITLSFSSPVFKNEKIFSSPINSPPKQFYLAYHRLIFYG